MTRDEFKEAIILDTLRRFMLNSDLSDRRISLLMGIEIETLRTLVAGTANPQKQSLNKIRSFLKWHGRKDKDWLSDYCRLPARSLRLTALCVTASTDRSCASENFDRVWKPVPYHFPAVAT